LLLLGCDAATSPLTDAGSDAATSDAGVPSPDPPVLTPCPTGWREVTDASGITTCDPWPASGYDASCAHDTMHLPGAPGCAPIGTPCPADGWPADVPSSGTIVYVDDGAPSGGDGSTHARALRTIGEAVARAPSGATILVATGRYDEFFSVTSAGVTVRGACVSGTVLTSSTPSSTGDAVVALAATNDTIANLSIDGAARVGVWIEASDGALEDVVVNAATGSGVGLDANGSLTHVAIRGTRWGSSDLPGFGVTANTGVTLGVRRSVIEGNTFVGISGGTLDLSDVLVSGTHPEPGTGMLGDGIDLTSGGSATLARVVLEQNSMAGLAASDPGTHVDAQDLVVRDTQSPSAGVVGAGVLLGNGATATLARVWCERNHDIGLGAFDVGTSLSVSDFVVRDTMPALGGGYGAAASQSATLALRRGLLDHDTGVALFAAYGATVDASDLALRNTAVTPPSADGAGVLGQQSAVLHLMRARVEHMTLFGVGALNGSTIMLDGVVVDGVAHTDCCPPEVASFGLVADFGGSLSATNFLVTSSDVCGVAVGAPDPVMGAASMDLSNGVIDHAAIGACIEADGYDVERLHRNVLLRDVATPLQVTTYTLPTLVTGP
jgi:hypothetical protein